MLLCHTLVRPTLLQNPWVQPAADIVNRGERATGGQCRGVPPSHDCQLEVAVDELARAAAPAEQTQSGSSWRAMRRLCLHEPIPLTATLVGVAMSAFEGEHNPRRVPTLRQKETSSWQCRSAFFQMEGTSRVEGRGGKSKQSSPRSEDNWLRQSCVARERQRVNNTPNDACSR